MSEEECDTYNLSGQVRTLEERYNTYKTKCKQMERIIQNLQLELALEKLKINVAIQQLKQHNINVEELFNGAEVKSVLPLIEPKKKKTGKMFRTVKNIELSEEKPEEQEAKINEIETKKEELIQANQFDVSIKEVTTLINSSFEELVKNRIYKKSLESIRDNRSKLFGKLNLVEYTNLIKTHISRAENIFTQKKCDPKKITTLVCQSLTPLEQHLVMYANYYNVPIEMDELQKVKAVLEIHSNFPRRYIPFSINDLFQRLYNYSVALFSVQDILKRSLINNYGFNNLAYINMNKSETTNDPYSFYSLEKIDAEGKRMWKMECRLDDMSKQISSGLRTYCISLFRKFYFDMFNDNLYRSDYANTYPLGQGECEQLLHNIVLLCRQRTFCDLCRNIVMQACEIHLTKLDTVNFQADDKLNKRQFAQEKDEIGDWINTVQQLFDDFSDEDAKRFAETIWFNSVN